MVGVTFCAVFQVQQLCQTVKIPLMNSERILVRAIFYVAIAVLVLAEINLYDSYLNPRVTNKYQRDYIYYSRLLEENPEDIEAYIALAEAYAGLDDIDRAIETLKRAERKFPLDYRPLLEMGRLYFLQGDYEEAREMLERALQRNPRSGSTYFYLGMIAYREQRYAVAAFYFWKSTELEPEAGDAHLYLAKTYENMKLYDAAEQQYREALKYLPDSEEAKQGIERIKAKKGEG